VGVVTEARHQVLHVLVDERVRGDLVHPAVVLLLGRQLAVEEQVGGLEVVALLGELVRSDSRVIEDALVPVEK